MALVNVICQQNAEVVAQTPSAKRLAT